MVEAEATAAGLRGGDAPAEETSIKFAVRLPAIAFVLAVGLVLRLALAFLQSFQIDTGTFQAWSNQLATNDPWNFYDTDFFTDYAPGYMYVLWLFGELNQVFHFSLSEFEYLLKVPSIAADVASAYLLYLLLKGQRQEYRLGAAALYLLFPPVLLIGPVWGQVDSLLAFFLLLSIFFIGRERPMAGALAFTVGFLIKPQIIAALPFLAFWIMRRHPPEVWARIAGASLALLLVLILPFFTYKPWELIPQLYDATNIESYRVDSFFAYNVWTVEGGLQSGFKPDISGIQPNEGTILGVDDRVWGFLLFGGLTAGILYTMRKSEGVGALALGAALCVLIFYLFMTRMHERYVFGFFLPFLAAAVALRSRVLLAAFLGIGAIHFFNLYHVYVYYQCDPNHQCEIKWAGFFKWFEPTSNLGTGLDTVQLLSILLVAALPLLFAVAYGVANRARWVGVSEGA